MKSWACTSVVVASVGLFVASCSGGGTTATGDEGDLLLGLQAVEPKAGPITDQTVHLTCKVIGARDQTDAEVEYIFGVADAKGVAQEPLRRVTAFGGFVELVDLMPDTAYAVTFVARLNGRRGAFAPSLTFKTAKPLDADQRFGHRVVPGKYARAKEDQRNEEQISVTLVATEDASCPSKVALAGNLGAFGWSCMDFRTMTASRQIGADSATYTFDFCDCDALTRDFEPTIRQACMARAGRVAACKDQWGQPRSNVQFVVTGSENVGGLSTTSTYLKVAARR